MKFQDLVNIFESKEDKIIKNRDKLIKIIDKLIKIVKKSGLRDKIIFDPENIEYYFINIEDLYQYERPTEEEFEYEISLEAVLYHLRSKIYTLNPNDINYKYDINYIKNTIKDMYEGAKANDVFYDPNDEDPSKAYKRENTEFLKLIKSAYSLIR